MRKRNTQQKKIVREKWKKLEGRHPTAADVYQEVKKETKTISQATVYRILSQMMNEGEGQRVRIPGGADRYDHRLDVHVHLRCKKCDRVVDGEMMEMGKVVVPSTWEIEGRTIVFEGLCHTCAPKKIVRV